MNIVASIMPTPATDATLFAHMIEIGVLWNRLNVQEQMDYEDAIGLRG